MNNILKLGGHNLTISSIKDNFFFVNTELWCLSFSITADNSIFVMLLGLNIFQFYHIKIYVCYCHSFKVLTGACCATLLRGRSCCVSLLIALSTILLELSQLFVLAFYYQLQISWFVNRWSECLCGNFFVQIPKECC